MLRGQEIVRNRKEIVAALNRALAAELADAYRYRFLANWASGLQADHVARVFSEMSDHEWGHVASFIKRIIQLGGRPLDRLSDVDKITYTPYQAPPKEPTDLRRMIEDSLKGERAAIDFYNRLASYLRDADPITHHLLCEALEDEVEDEHRLASLLAKA